MRLPEQKRDREERHLAEREEQSKGDVGNHI